MTKIVLCFIINDRLHHEKAWQKWITENNDIVDFFFHNKNEPTSPWIKEHCLPRNYIADTDYFHIVPAYMNLFMYTFFSKTRYSWFVMLTESCVPVLSPTRFREMWTLHRESSMMQWGKAYWNIHFHKRANLYQLPEEYHLFNDPWFILTHRHVECILSFLVKYNKLYKMICNGVIANESIFAIMLKKMGKLKEINSAQPSHLVNWSQMSSRTSPYVFRSLLNEPEYSLVTKMQLRYPSACFLRKVNTTSENVNLFLNSK